MDIAALTRRTVPTGILVLLTASCGTPDEDPEGPAGPEDAPATAVDDTSAADAADAEEPGEVRIPQEWLEITAEEYPESDGFASSQPRLVMGEGCLILDELPEFFEDEAEASGSGFGSYGRPSVNYGNEPSSEEHYRYLCNLRPNDEAREADTTWGTPSLQLMVTEDPELAEETVQDFLSQDLPDQDNDIETVEVGDAEIHVTKRSFPTNPNAGGELQAIFYDEDAQAILQLRLQSMDEDLWEEHGHEGIAEDMVRLLQE